MKYEIKTPAGSREMSPLTEGRGLKLPQIKSGIEKNVVAPHGGAWIEIRPLKFFCCRIASPLTEGRGLKSSPSRWLNEERWSPLTEGRGLK